MSCHGWPPSSSSSTSPSTASVQEDNSHPLVYSIELLLPRSISQLSGTTYPRHLNNRSTAIQKGQMPSSRSSNPQLPHPDSQLSESPVPGMMSLYNSSIAALPQTKLPNPSSLTPSRLSLLGSVGAVILQPIIALQYLHPFSRSISPCNLSLPDLFNSNQSRKLSPNLPQLRLFRPNLSPIRKRFSRDPLSRSLMS